MKIAKVFGRILSNSDERTIAHGERDSRDDVFQFFFSNYDCIFVRVRRFSEYFRFFDLSANSQQTEVESSICANRVTLFESLFNLHVSGTKRQKEEGECAL